MTDTHNKKKTNTDFFINFIKKELLESDFKDQLQLQLLYIIIPIIIIIAILNFFTTLGAMFLFKINC
jgi:hypothetical protein|tara:strand:+ start:91 stop:291 length:201 start_codon:yes stop_codon:yes gene_type:complete